MSEPAMMREAKNPALELAEYVQVWRFGGKCHRSRGEGSFAIESSSSHASAGQEVSDRFQSLLRPCFVGLS